MNNRMLLLSRLRQGSVPGEETHSCVLKGISVISCLWQTRPCLYRITHINVSLAKPKTRIYFRKFIGLCSYILENKLGKTNPNY